MRRVPLRSAWMLTIAVLPLGASAVEYSGSVALYSDYLYRGRTLTEGSPTAALGMGLDDAGGSYGGLTIVPSRLPGQGHWGLALRPYAGVACACAAGLTWDTGITASRFTGAPPRDYPEIYGGVARDGLTSRLSFPLHRGDTGSSGPYLELGLTRPVEDHLQLTLHAGALIPGGGAPQGAGSVWDLRAGVEYALEDLVLTAEAVTVVQPGSSAIGMRYADYYSGATRKELLITLARTF